MDLSEALKKMRKLNNITQSEAARAAGVSVTQYQKYEYGKNEPTASVLLALADHLDFSLDALLDRNVDQAANICASSDALEVAEAYDAAHPVLQQAMRRMLGLK